MLWPAEEDLYTLMQMRVEGGRTAFEREKQGSPIDPDVCEWPEIYFADHIWFDEWPSDVVIRAIALDPSKGRDAQHGDYSAYVLLGIDRDGMIYVEADLVAPAHAADGHGRDSLMPALFGRTVSASKPTSFRSCCVRAASSPGNSSGRAWSTSCRRRFTTR